MGLGFCIVLSALLLCCFVGWIVSYCLDHIAGLYQLDCLDWIGWIGLDRIVWMRTHRILCIGWLLLGWDGWGGWTIWGVGGTGVGRTVVSACRNGSAGTGAPPLALEGSRCAGWLLPTWDIWDGWIGWGVGGTGVVRTNVSTCQNRSATIGS